MIKQFKLAAGLATIATLVACGGGGDSSTANADPQGIWTGPASTGYTISAAVLENGETWGVYSSGSTIYGALYGTTTTNGNSVSIRGTDFNFLTNSSSVGNLTGPITAKSLMSLSSTGATVTKPQQLRRALLVRGHLSVALVCIHCCQAQFRLTAQVILLCRKQVASQLEVSCHVQAEKTSIT